MRGESAEMLAHTVVLNDSLEFLDLSFNLLGNSHDDEEPAIYAFAEMLARDGFLTELNLSNNLITSGSAFCLAQAVKVNKVI